MSNNNTIKIIISPSYGEFEPNRALAKQLKNCGHTNWSSIEARTDRVIIDYVEKQIIKSKLDFNLGFLGITKDQYLVIIEIETNVPWTISQNKGSEFIRYLSYEIIDSNINYCRETISNIYHNEDLKN